MIADRITLAEPELPATDWRVVARAAHRANISEREKTSADNEAREAARLQERFQEKLNGIFPEKLRPQFVFAPDGRHAATPDGAEFYMSIQNFEWSTRYEVCLMGECAECHDLLPSNGISSFSELGSLLDEWHPRYHDCWERQKEKGLIAPKPIKESVEEPDPTPAELLYDVVRQLIHEEIKDHVNDYHSAEA